MNKLEKFIAYFVNRHLLTNLLFVSVFIAGVFAWNNTSKEEMPDVTFDRIRISASYPGATAEEVEHFVTKPIEDKLKGMDGIYRITSTSSDGSSSITVELEQNYPDKDEAIMDIRNTVLDVKLPDDVRDEPRVRVFDTSKKAIIDIALIDTSRHLLDLDARRSLQQYVFALENQLLNLPEVNSVNKSGYLQDEIRIMLEPDKLREFNIPFNTVMREIKNNHVRQPAGNIEIKSEPKVTLLSELDTVDKLNDLIIQGGFEGQVVKLRQIADVQRTFKKSKAIIKINGHEGIMLRVVKSSSFGILEALKAVRKVTENFEKNNLGGTVIDLVMLDDESVDLRNRLSIIKINGLIGFTLILILLFIFLDFRAGIWVAMGIPFTFFFAMVCIFIAGYTINNITLAAIIIVMGMIVDDAIVVSENISRLRSEGLPSAAAAIKGTAFVFLPIVASVLTTCLAFTPLFFFEARFARMLIFIPTVIFFMLGASLFESLVILPSHMHLKLPLLNKISGIFSKNKTAGKKTHWFGKVEDSYGRFLEKVLPFKWVIFSVFILLLAFSVYIMKSKMKFVMFPREETRQISISGEALRTANRYDTADLTKKIEEIIKPYIGREVIGFRTQIARSRRGRAVQENKFSMNVEIVTKEKRKKSADMLIGEWEVQIKSIEGLTNYRIAKSHWQHASGSPIELVVRENNNGIRDAIAKQMAESMKNHPALINVEIDRPLKNLEYRIILKREKIKRLSINPSDIASTLRAALEGTVLYELSSGDEEIDVKVTAVDSAKDDIERILDIPIENRRDYLVPLRDIVDVRKTNSPNSIERKDGKRITKVFADIKEGSGFTAVDIAEYFEKNDFPGIISLYPTAMIKFEGEVQDTRESRGELKNAVIMAVILIYFVLMLLFNSIVKPIIIMLAIPFGVVGIILAFWLHGKVLFGFFAAIGALGLAGVVVNDSIIMIAKLDKVYDKKQDRKFSNKQVASIAKTRLRAVILTTLTTVAGIAPTAYGFAGYDAMLAEMMLAIIWGLLFGTFITLILIPCVYSVSKDLTFLKSRMFQVAN